MNDRKSTSPLPTQPRKSRRVSQRGMFSLLMSLISLGALGSAMLGGAKLSYDVLGPSRGVSPGLVGAVIALGVAYLIGWAAAMLAIRVYGNLILPVLLNAIMWLWLAGICYLYVEIIERLYMQQYDAWGFARYVLVMGAALAALVGLHLIVEGHNLRPFAIPLLITNLIQLGLIVFRYVFVGGKSIYILGDLFFLIGMAAFSILMLAHIGLLDPLRARFTNYFDRNSTSIRTPD